MSARTQVTLAQFTSRVYDTLGNNSFWTSDEIRQYINSALRTWNSLTGYWHGRITYTTTPNTIYYCLPSTLVFGAHVEFNGVPITKSSIFDWDQADPHWASKRGPAQEWSPIGIRIISLRPIDPAGGNSVTVDGVTVTPILVNSNDYIDIGEEEFKSLVDYIHHVAAFKEGGQEFGSTVPLYKQLIASAGAKNEKLRASALYRRVMGLDETSQRKYRRLKTELNATVGMH